MNNSYKAVVKNLKQKIADRRNKVDKLKKSIGVDSINQYYMSYAYKMAIDQTIDEIYGKEPHRLDIKNLPLIETLT